MTFAALDASILAALRDGETLTPAIAASRWRCLALHSAIARLRDAGHPIRCTMRSENGKRFGEYTLTAILQPDQKGAAILYPLASNLRITEETLVTAYGRDAEGKEFAFRYTSCRGEYEPIPPALPRPLPRV